MISEANGYGHKGRRPAGRSIVEERGHNGKLTVWVQDMRTETRYSVFMVFQDGRRYAGVAMGNLAVDEKGKGELRREFEHEELGSFILADVVAVAVIAKDSAGVVSPLCGYKDEPVSWRHGFYEYSVTAKVVNVKHEAAPVHVETPPVAKVLPSATEVTAVEEVVEDRLLAEEADMLQKKPVAQVAVNTPPPMHDFAPEDEMPEKSAAPAVTAKVPESISTEPATTTNESPELTTTISMELPGPITPLATETPEPTTTETPRPTPPAVPTSPSPAPQQGYTPPYDPAPVTQHTKATKKEIAESFRMALDQLHADTIQRSTPAPQSLEELFAIKECVTPFKRQSRKTTWVKFDLSDQVPPPTNKPHLFKDPFIQAALAKHGHLLLGMTVAPGAKHYIIGVPDNPTQDSRQKARRLGFTQFKRHDDSNPKKDEPGYWLMFITA